MKVVSSWPNYMANTIIAVTEDGEVYGLPMLEDGRLIVNHWHRLAPWITRESCDLSAHDSSIGHAGLSPSDLPGLAG